MAPAVWGWLSTGILAAAPSVLSPKHHPVTPQAFLLYSARFCQSPELVVTSEILCIGPLKGSLLLQPSVPGREKSYCFSQLDVFWVLFRLWCYRLGHPSWGLYPTFLRGILLDSEIFLRHFSGCPLEPSQLSCISSTLCTSHVWWSFLLSVHGYKASLPQLFSCLFCMISLQFSCHSWLVLVGG